jgi:hypothetical protein
MLAFVPVPLAARCTGQMQNENPDALARNHRVQRLCHEVGELVALSREQRRAIDELLARLEAVMRRARHRVGRGSWRSAESR